MEPEQDRIARVQDALLDAGIVTEILLAPESTHTAALAAAVAGCELGQIVKTLVVYVAGTPQLALVAGDRRLDDRLVAARAGVGRKQVKLADGEQVLALTGYPVGGVSPVGLPAPLPAVMDASLRRFETVWIAAGTPFAICPVPLEQFARVLSAEYAEIAS